MKKKTSNTGSTPPWESTPEEPQKITAGEASAAAAVMPGRKPGTPGTRGTPGTTGDPCTTGDPGSTEPASPGRNRWQPSQTGYRWVVRNVSYLLFLALLAVIYIYNGHYADKISRDLNKTNKEVKDLQYEYKTLKSEVMFRSKESELAKAVGPFGLKELTQPPFLLTDTVEK